MFTWTSDRSELLIDLSFLQNTTEACPFPCPGTKSTEYFPGTLGSGGVVGSKTPCSRVGGSPAVLPSSAHCWSPHPTTGAPIPPLVIATAIANCRQTAVCHNIFLLIHLARYSPIHLLLPWTLVYCSYRSAQVFSHKNMDTCTTLCTQSKSNASGKQQMLPL